MADELLSINKRCYQVFLTSEHVLACDHEPCFWVQLVCSVNRCLQECPVCSAGTRVRGHGASAQRLSAAYTVEGRQTTCHTDSSNCGGCFEGQGHFVVMAAGGQEGFREDAWLRLRLKLTR